MKTLRPLGSIFVSILALSLIGCRGGSIEGWSSRARTMILTSGPAEIVMSSSKVPGYWARQAADEQEFFLYTRDRTYEKGCHVRVEGPFGYANVSFFREETGVYWRESPMPTCILVVWKMARSDDQDIHGLVPQEATDRARRH